MDRTAEDQYTKTGRAVGMIGGFVLGYGIIGMLLGRFLGRKISANMHSTEISKLERAIRNDTKAMSIVSKIKEAMDSKDKTSFKSLKKEFALRVQDLKRDIELGDLKESAPLVRETLRSGLFESLAVNEAQNMLAEGKTYDADLCLAKAIMYVTITEAMGEMGLINVDDKKYAQMITAAGGNLNETTFTNGAWSNKGKSAKNRRVKGENLSLLYGTENGKEYWQVDGKGKKYFNKPDADAALANEKQKLLTPNKSGGGRPVDYKNVNKQIEELNESVLVSQYKPVLNSAYDPNSMAERLRKKRLAEQAENLNE